MFTTKLNRMKKRLFTVRSAAFVIGAVLLSIVVAQCKKEGGNAAALSRSVSEKDLDSTVFSPFYDTTLLKIAVQNSVNDVIVTTGIQTIIKSNCATANCHGGSISPALGNYAQIRGLVKPGDPEGSSLWQMITTHNLDKAMPPVTVKADIALQDKIAIYNWIKNGANETPVLADYKASAVRILTGGCTAQCHNTKVAVGSWARSYSFGRALSTADTITGMSFGRSGCVSINDTLTARVWNAYKDSVLRFYSDTARNLAYKPVKSIGTAMGPLNTYEDLVFDIIYPKGGRKLNNPYNAATSSYNLLTRIDSTLAFVNPVTKTSSVNGSMSRADGHMTSSEIAIVKGWYFADPNIPDLWKYGSDNKGIFKDANGNMITKK
jgi:hypothetical protein